MSQLLSVRMYCKVTTLLAMMTRMMPVTVMLLMMVTKSIITGTMMQARVSIY